MDLAYKALSAVSREKFPKFKAGDTVDISLKISKGGKERIQHFKGIVIQRRHPNTNGETITVRKIVDGIAVERILPILSPIIDKIEVVQYGVVRRARLFYLRELKGKNARVKQKFIKKEIVATKK
ncbi:MAG: 50S ribosomal protein L19 [Cytophagales bacterium]|nr:50S ribosomal protein L19 [Cytophagales bacterium]